MRYSFNLRTYKINGLGMQIVTGFPDTPDEKFNA